MRKFFFALAFVFISVVQSEANDVVIKAGAGYGAGIQRLTLESTTTQNFLGSFGGNFGVYAGCAVAINEHVELGVDAGFQSGRTIKISEYKSYTGRFAYISPSLTFNVLVDEPITPYARVGLLTGKPLVKSNLTSVSTSSENIVKSTTSNKFKGHIPFGFLNAVGANYNISDSFKLFAEITHQSMLYKPRKIKDENGATTKFSNNVTNSSSELAHYVFSFGAVGINAGIKVVF